VLPLIASENIPSTRIVRAVRTISKTKRIREFGNSGDTVLEFNSGDTLLNYSGFGPGDAYRLVGVPLGFDLRG
jgi:hypothetical protein